MHVRVGARASRPVDKPCAGRLLGDTGRGRGLGCWKHLLGGGHVAPEPSGPPLAASAVVLHTRSGRGSLDRVFLLLLFPSGVGLSDSSAQGWGVLDALIKLCLPRYARTLPWPWGRERRRPRPPSLRTPSVKQRLFSRLFGTGFKHTHSKTCSRHSCEKRTVCVTSARSR